MKIHKIIYISRNKILENRESFFNACMLEFDWIDEETRLKVFDLCVRHYSYYFYYAMPVLGESFRFNRRNFALPLAAILRRRLKQIERGGLTMTNLSVLGSGMSTAWRISRALDCYTLLDFEAVFPACIDDYL